MPTYNLKEETIQHGFHFSRKKIQVFGGGFGNGKTTAMVIKALRLVADYPGCNGLLGRSTYPKLKDTLQRIFFEWCPPEWVKRYPTKDDNTCHFNNGSIVNFRYISQRGKHAADGSTTSNLLSATYDWIGVDQVEDPEITQKDIMDLMGRLRGNTPYRPEGYDDATMPDTGPRWMMLSCNPTANWFFKTMIHPYLIFKERGIRLDTLPLDRSGNLIMELHEGSTYTNADNLPPDYIEGLESMYRGQMRERFLMGGWAAFEGLVHGAFDIRVHCISRNDAIDHLEDCLERHVKLKIIEGYDFGISSPTCYGFGIVDDFGRVILLDGFYEPDFDYSLHRSKVDEIRERYTSPYQLAITERIRADPGIWRQKTVGGTKDVGETVAELLEKEGMKLRPATNDILPGIVKINTYLADKPEVPHLVTNVEPSPLFYVVDDLQWFMDEVSNYYWKKDAQQRQMDEPQEHNDHAMNMWKYMLAFQPKPADIVLPRSALTPQYRFWHEMDENEYRQVSRGR